METDSYGMAYIAVDFNRDSFKIFSKPTLLPELQLDGYNVKSNSIRVYNEYELQMDIPTVISDLKVPKGTAK